ncbi:MAG TPA: sigma 54-interacting transcriptional regulator [Vicinamibacterales bacterium]|nr:sigma 54-interacting transcriptional regulator [Vicinamibacterales bacterium]
MVTIAFQPALARARAALARGRHADAVAVLTQALKSSGLKHEDEVGLRCTLAEAWLQGDDLAQAASTVGRPPDSPRDDLPPALLSALWRIHGRIAFAKGEQSRAIALLGRALRHAEQAHDSEAIGLAHYELGLCYKQVGDTAIVREHIAKAAPALHAAGNRRYLALLHSLSGIVLAQGGRIEEALAALRQAERLATTVPALDVLGIISNNQANVALLQHRHEQALALSERSAAQQEQIGPGRGLAISLATLGQILVRLGQLERAEKVLHRALQVRTPVQFHEITGAVFDTLAQIALMRGGYESAGDYLRQAGEAYGGYGALTSQWYEWSIRVLEAKLAARRGATEEALRLANEIAASTTAPPAEAIQADLIACEALLAAGRSGEADARLSSVAARIDKGAMRGAWGEFLRLRGALHASAGRLSEAYHDIAQSASVFELVGEGYQGALSHLALGQLASRVGARSQAEHQFKRAAALFESLGAARDLVETQSAAAKVPTTESGDTVVVSIDADDAIVRRLVDAAAFPELLGHETAAAVRDTLDADCAVVFVAPADGELRLVAWTGGDPERAKTIAARAMHRAEGTDWVVSEQLGLDIDGPRYVAILSPHAPADALHRRLRMIAAIAAQGFELCAARQRPAAPAEAVHEQPLEPLLPGFLCASPAMMRVVEQIQRLQGNELTVLITGESGTGKELVARAIHVGSLRSSAVFLPFNCTTTTREMADSQLFGHRRGSFTGAVNDQLGLVRTAAGGTLFLDEIGDLPLDVQPKLLRFLEQAEIMPVGEPRPQRVDVRVIAATNADLEQRVAEGKFREDLYYRLTVIRILIPPLRDRREEIPHLTSLFLREASERLGKPDVFFTPETLELLAQYWWPGNVRQLRNEIQGMVALSHPGRGIGPEHLSPEITSTAIRHRSGDDRRHAAPRAPATSLSAAVDDLEREIIESTLHQSGGNISEAARTLGLTRRGLYLKLRRLGFETASMADAKTAQEK